MPELSTVILRTSRLLLFASVWVLILSAAGHSQSVVFLNVEPGSFTTVANDLSDDGQTVVGLTQIPNPSTTFPYIWTQSGGVQVLTHANGSTGIGTSLANSVSADGSTVVGESFNQAFVWRAGQGFTSLGDFTGTPPFLSQANCVSSDGSVVTGYAFTSGSLYEAFSWTENEGLVGLGFLPGGTESLSFGISRDGSSFVGSSSDVLPQAFRLTPHHGMVGLGFLPGGSESSIARAISNDGTVVVGSASSEFGSQAFRWTEQDGMVGLGDVPGGSFSSVAYDVSGDGEITVGNGSNGNGGVGVLWNANAEIITLKELLQRFGIALTVDPYRCQAVSENGRITVANYIVGTGSSAPLLVDFQSLNLNWTSNASGNWDDLNNWTGRFFKPAETDNVTIDPGVGVTVFGPENARTIGQLTIGNGTALEIRELGPLTVFGDTNIAFNGQLKGSGEFHCESTITNSGEIDLGHDELRIFGDNVVNNWIISGDGLIDAPVNNALNGQILALDGQLITIGETDNFGEINLLGGGLQITNVSHNEASGFISGRGILIFDDDHFNSGVFAFSGGFMDILGDNENFGTIVTSSGGTTTFYDDVAHDGIEIRTSVGSITTFFGDCSGTGPFTGAGDVFMEGDLRPGASPGTVTFEGNLHLGSNSTTHIEIGGPAAGSEYDQLVIWGDAFLDGNLVVTEIDNYEIGPNDQFEIVDIDSSAFGEFNDLAEGDVVGNFNGFDLKISYVGGDGNDVVLFTDGVLLGDVNLDGAVNLLDVDDFVDRVASGTYQPEADCNIDGEVNLLDIAFFIAILGGS